MIVSRRIRQQRTKTRSRFLKSLDVESLLRSLGIKFSRMGRELYCHCVHPDHKKDRTPSWHIHSGIGDPKNSVFFCWSCHWTGNAITFVQAHKGLSFNDSISLLQPFVREKAEIISSTDPLTGLYPYEPGEIEYEWRGEGFEPKPIVYGSPAFAYLVNRGIGKKDIEFFKIQDWTEAGRIIVPIHRGGKLISWIGRTYRGETPKVWAPVGAPKKWEIFGLDLVTNWKEANLSEGWADVIRLYQSGQINPLGLCGSRMSEQQAEIISRFEKLRVWTDGDLAGRGLALDIATWLPGKEIEVVQCPDNQDPGSLDVEEIQKLQPQSYREWRNSK